MPPVMNPLPYGASLSPEYGPVLLTIRQALFYSLILVIGGLIALIFSLVAPASEFHLGLRILVCLFGLSLLAVGIRHLRNRPLMMELREGGILIHANADGVCISTSLLRDLFIPWQRMDSIHYLTSTEVNAQGLWRVSGGWGKADPVVMIRISMDWSWPPSGTLRDLVARGGRPGEIYLNLEECAPGKIQLWQQIEAIAGRHGVSSPGTG